MIEYRVEIILWALSGVLPLIMLSLWLGSSAASVFGYNNEQLTRYFLSVFVVRQFTAVWVMVSFEEDTIEGRISPYLLQPITPFWRYYYSHIAEQISRIPIVLFLLIVFFACFPSSFWFPSLVNIALFLVIMYISFTIRFLLHWTFAMLSFSFERASSLERLLMIPYLFLSGLLAPIDSFPYLIQKIVMFTPYPYLLSFPAKFLAGQEVNFLRNIYILILWLTIFLITGILAWKRGVREYSSMGA